MTNSWNDAVPSRDRQFEMKRQALLRVAGQAFSRKGFHDTSLADVAREVKVTKTALYYYVSSKHGHGADFHGLRAELPAWNRGRTGGADALAHSGPCLPR